MQVAKIPGKPQGKKTHAGRRGALVSDRRSQRPGAGLVGVCVRTGDLRDSSDLREFLFGGVDLRHRMSHVFAPHVPLGVVLRVDLEGIAAA